MFDKPTKIVNLYNLALPHCFCDIMTYIISNLQNVSINKNINPLDSCFHMGHLPGTCRNHNKVYAFP